MPRGLFDNPTIHQIYGRNNPSPMAPRSLRGYELWVTIPADYPLDPDVVEVIFTGGVYAVVRSKGISGMIKTYEKIFGWIQASDCYAPDYPFAYDFDRMPGWELEHYIDPYCEDENAMPMDVYVPVRARG